MFNLLIWTLFSIFLFFIQLILINQLIFLDHVLLSISLQLFVFSDFMIYYSYLLLAAISIMNPLLQLVLYFGFLWD